jgi:hypothetical protein
MLLTFFFPIFSHLENMVFTNSPVVQATKSKQMSYTPRYLIIAVAAMVILQGFSLIRYCSSIVNPATEMPLQLEGLVQASSTASSSSSSAMKETATTPTLHILQGLQGNKTGFIDQWEVNLKSILLNAPLDANLHIHIPSNAAAKEAVLQHIQAAGLADSPWRNQVSITVYNVE